MKDNLSIVILMIIFVMLIVFFPLYNYFERQDDMSYNLVLRETTTFVDKVLSNGYISNDTYQEFLDSLANTGNLYDVQLEAHKRIITSDTQNNAKGYKDYIEQYEIDYNDDILSIDPTKNNASLTNKQIKGGIYTLEVGDQFYVKLKNSSTTMAGAIFNSIISTSSTERIVVNYGGIVKSNSWKKVDANYFTDIRDLKRARITYHTNAEGVTFSNNSNTVRGESFVPGDVVFSAPDIGKRDGYELLGYDKNKSSTNPEYKIGSSYKIDGEIEVYAIWGKIIQKNYSINGQPYETLGGAFSAAKNGDTIKLEKKDFKEKNASTLTSSNGKSITLDLNSWNLNIVGTSIWIHKGTLTIKNGSITYLTISDTDKQYKPCIIGTGGNLTLNKGATINGGSAGILNTEDGYINIYGTVNSSDKFINNGQRASEGIQMQTGTLQLNEGARVNGSKFGITLYNKTTNGQNKSKDSQFAFYGGKVTSNNNVNSTPMVINDNVNVTIKSFYMISAVQVDKTNTTKKYVTLTNVPNSLKGDKTIEDFYSLMKEYAGRRNQLFLKLGNDERNFICNTQKEAEALIAGMKGGSSGGLKSLKYTVKTYYIGQKMYIEFQQKN